MSKWQEFKGYITNPPPHIIAMTEYRGHFLNILGVLAVSIVLFMKGLWYIIFAFIFSCLVSWAQGMSAHARYKTFMSLLPEETFEYVLEDKSFTRRRGRLLKLSHAWWLRWLILPSCFVLAVGLIGLEPFAADWRLRIFGFTVFLISYYVVKLAVVTFVFYIAFVYGLITGLLEYIHKKKRELLNGVQTVVS